MLQRKLMEQVDGILAVHEFHVWQLTGDRIIASAHIRCLNLAQYMEVSLSKICFTESEQKNYFSAYSALYPDPRVCWSLRF